MTSMGQRTLLRDAFPEIAAELVDPTLLASLTAHSGRKVSWRCPKGHVYEATVNNRTNGSGCPYCAGRKVLVGFNDVATMHPEVASLCCDEDAMRSVTAASHRRFVWHCDHGHTWEASVANVVQGTRCPVCAKALRVESRRQTLAAKPKAASRRRPGTQSLADARPDLVPELRDAHDADLAASSHQKVWWVCGKDARHVWQAEVVSRTRGSGCPFCAGRQAIPGVDDLATLRPDVAAHLVDPDDAIGITVGSGRKRLWQCAKGHTWEATVRNMVRSIDRGTDGCPVCSSHMSNRGRHGTVAEERPDLLADAVDPGEVGGLTVGSGKVVDWVCRNHDAPHTYKMSVRKRAIGQGCPICGHRVIVTGVNDLATLRPDLAGELVDQTQATLVGVGSERLLEWRCSRGHTWTAAVYARVAGNGCPLCNSGSPSTKESALLDVVRALTTDVQSHVRIPCDGHPRGLEIDMVAGRLAIEFNGTFWHSERWCRRGDLSTRVDAMVAADLEPYVVWEDDWDDVMRRQVILSNLAYRLHARDRLRDAFTTAGLASEWSDDRVARHGARTLAPREMPSSAVAGFLDLTHIQGAVSCSKAFALCDDAGKPWAVLCIRSPRMRSRQHGREGEWEITRYATLGSVPGGFSRLLRYAEAALGDELTSWVTMSDRCVSLGSLYDRCGFDRDRLLPPSYCYTGGMLRGRRVSKESFQVKRFKTDSRLLYEDGWTESTAAAANRLLRVWDAGKVRWAKHLTR